MQLDITKEGDESSNSCELNEMLSVDYGQERAEEKNVLNANPNLEFECKNKSYNEESCHESWTCTS